MYGVGPISAVQHKRRETLACLIILGISRYFLVCLSGSRHRAPPSQLSATCRRLQHLIWREASRLNRASRRSVLDRRHNLTSERLAPVLYTDCAVTRDRNPVVRNLQTVALGLLAGAICRRSSGGSIQLWCPKEVFGDD